MRMTRRARIIRLSLLAVLLLVASYTLYLDFRVRSEFEGRRFALPARIYARPLELHAGLRVPQAAVEDELRQLGYRAVPSETESGWYQRHPAELEIALRPFVFWDGPQAAQRVRVAFDDKGVVALRDRAGAELALVRLDPLLIGGIYPSNNEDRVLVRLKEVPKHLVNALVAIEDRKYFSHAGVDPRGMARAVWQLASGEVQGGSTLTQQLVKNFFLTRERTLQRKFTEVIMALLLELHYGKEEILETYLNEIYLGQDRDRAIHGIGLAAQFYFGKPVQDLSLAEGALLVGMVKGPTLYDPRRHPQRALERRNLVLREMRSSATSASSSRRRRAPARWRWWRTRRWAPPRTPRSWSWCTGSCGATTTRPTCAPKACVCFPRSTCASRPPPSARCRGASRSSTRTSVSASPAWKARWSPPTARPARCRR
jgi:penicillin-binding protein 1B